MTGPLRCELCGYLVSDVHEWLCRTCVRDEIHAGRLTGRTTHDQWRQARAHDDHEENER